MAVAGSDETLLYRDEQVSVSASWLSLGEDSVAIRYVRRMRLSSVHPPRAAALALFVMALLGLMVVGWNVRHGSLPGWFTGVMLVATLAAGAWASHVAFVMPAWHTLTLELTGDKPLVLRQIDRHRLEAIRDAVARAVDRHRSSSVPDAPSARSVAAAGRRPGEPRLIDNRHAVPAASSVRRIGAQRAWVDPQRALSADAGPADAGSADRVLPSTDAPPEPEFTEATRRNRAARDQRLLTATVLRPDKH